MIFNKIFNYCKKIFYNNVSLKEILIFTDQISILLHSKISIIDTLDIISLNSKNKNVSSMLKSIKENILSGYLLSKSLYPYKRILGDVYINMIKVGESSGSLEITFKRLSIYLKKKNTLKTKLINILIYPLFIIFFSIVLIYLIMIYFIPQIAIILLKNKTELPLITKILLLISSLINDQWYLILIIIIIIGFCIKYYFSTAHGHFIYDSLILKIPFVGNIISMSIILEFLRTVLMLLEEGVPISTSLKITKGTINNIIIKKEINKIYNSIKNGYNISNTIKNSNFFPPIVIQMIIIGEKTGDIEHSLKSSSNFLEQSMEYKMNLFMNSLGPILTIFIGLIIGIIMLATLLPLFQMYNLIN